MLFRSKIYKKLPAIVLSLMLCFSFYSCGKSDSKSTSQDTTNQSISNNITTNVKEIDLNGKLSISTVRDDVTGNWRLCRVSDSSLNKFEEFVLDYYNKAFDNDSEIHAVVNFNNKTTTRISSNGVFLYVTVFDYVEKEEHSANTLFTGTMLSDYIVTIKDGSIEKIK